MLLTVTALCQEEACSEAGMFRDRVDAGRQLAACLSKYRGKPDVVVLGIPRGGVLVALEVARGLDAPLDTFLVRKLGAPRQKELAIGAIAGGGLRFLDHDLIRQLGITQEELLGAITEQEKELRRREDFYRDVRPALKIEGAIAILVDDGIATGSSMVAAVNALRRLKPARIVVAVPVAPAHARDLLTGTADDFIAVEVPDSFYAVGQFYENFPQITDAEVRDLLRSSTQETTGLQESGAA